MLTFIHMLGGYALFSFFVWFFTVIVSVACDAEVKQSHAAFTGFTILSGVLSAIAWLILFILHTTSP
jgi:hypothetical protein